jgi:hypothetical protein
MTYTMDKVAAAYGSALELMEKEAIRTLTPAQMKAIKSRRKPAAQAVKQTFGGVRRAFGRVAGTPGGNPAIMNAVRSAGRAG